MRAAARAAPSARDGAVPAAAAELFCDRLGNALRCGGRVLHAPARAMAVEAVRDVAALLEMPLEREVEEWPPRRDELHRRREPALHDADIAGGEPAVQAVDIAVQLDAVRGEARRIDARAADRDHAQIGQQPPRGRLGVEHACRRWEPTPEPPTATRQICSSSPQPSSRRSAAHSPRVGGSKPVMWPLNAKRSSTHGRISGSPGPKRPATMSPGSPTKTERSRTLG